MDPSQKQPVATHGMPFDNPFEGKSLVELFDLQKEACSHLDEMLDRKHLIELALQKLIGL